MTTPGLTAWADQSRRAATDAIRRHGCWITYVSDTEGCACCAALGNRAERRAAGVRKGGARRAAAPPFGYTTGLFGAGHPELLVFGLSPAETSTLLNGLTHEVVHGGDLTPGEEVAPAWFPRRILVEEVPNPGQILYQANDYYERSALRSVPAPQLTWTDGLGRFPWDDGYALAAGHQPRPGTFRA